MGSSWDAVAIEILGPLTVAALRSNGRRATPAAFGTLMATEPAIGVVLGVLVLHQTPTIVQIVGIILVVIAVGAAQGGGRRPRSGRHANLDLIG